ncbi:hypothetical protein EUGRSUZ_B02423 [Eucalyptus grandis]|uniref:Uncharacterized protein n=2 Tax=Eucalyptus grandis TaxID=71139 RepID=A0ACC3LU26_EUCGR|nr:hypothetical protein EUGRSUZ_B02423 [Eucalyptus grandis]
MKKLLRWNTHSMQLHLRKWLSESSETPQVIMQSQLTLPLEKERPILSVFDAIHGLLFPSLQQPHHLLWQNRWSHLACIDLISSFPVLVLQN